MRALMLALSATALGILLVAGSAGAYPVPKQAKKMSVEMVTAFDQCTAPTLTHRPSLALPSCVPVASSANHPANTYEFGQRNGKPDGSMSVVFQSTKLGPVFTIKSKSIWKNGAPYTGDDLLATTIARVTDNGCGAAFDTDCTITDFPVPIPLTCTNGSCKVMPLVMPTVVSIELGHEAMNIEFGQISILDEDGDAVARGGLFVP